MCLLHTTPLSVTVYFSYFSVIFWFSSPWHDGTALKCSIAMLKESVQIAYALQFILEPWPSIGWTIKYNAFDISWPSPQIHSFLPAQKYTQTKHTGKNHTTRNNQFYYVNFSNVTVLLPWFEIYANQTELQINFRIALVLSDRFVVAWNLSRHILFEICCVCSWIQYSKFFFFISTNFPFQDLFPHMFLTRTTRLKFQVNRPKKYMKE